MSSKEKSSKEKKSSSSSSSRSKDAGGISGGTAIAPCASVPESSSFMSAAAAGATAGALIGAAAAAQQASALMNQQQASAWSHQQASSVAMPVALHPSFQLHPLQEPGLQPSGPPSGQPLHLAWQATPPASSRVPAGFPGASMDHTNHLAGPAGTMGGVSSHSSGGAMCHSWGAAARPVDVPLQMPPHMAGDWAADPSFTQSRMSPTGLPAHRADQPPERPLHQPSGLPSVHPDATRQGPPSSGAQAAPPVFSRASMASSEGPGRAMPLSAQPAVGSKALFSGARP
jgi:hypothetical protein